MEPLNVEPLAGSSPELLKKIKELNDKVGLCVHAPVNIKEVQRMQPFATDSEVVKTVLSRLKNYKIIPSTGEGEGEYVLEGIEVNYDIVGFWYLIALLAQSTESSAQEYLLNLADELIRQGPGELNILRRIALLLEDLPHLKPVNDKMTTFYNSIFSTLESYKWMQEVGMSYPSMWEWEIVIRFSSDGEYFYSKKGIDPLKYFFLNLSIFSPKSVFRHSTQLTSYDIEIDNVERNIRGQFNERDGYMNVNYKYAHENLSYTPLQLSELFDFLETQNIHLLRTPDRIYATKGIRKAQIKKWLERELGEK